MELSETFLVSFATFFATMGPIDVAALYAAMTPRNTSSERRTMALKGALIATGILLLFAFLGASVLKQLGISLPALRIAGGILLLLISIDMVFARSSGGTSTTSDEAEEAASKPDVSVFPLATPLIAGPGTMGAVILLMAEATGDVERETMVIGALLLNLFITLVLCLMAAAIARLLGVTGLNVITRVVGVLLSALAIQFMIDGIRSSGLLG
jgi:multiple antibiotic resistance protein